MPTLQTLDKEIKSIQGEYIQYYFLNKKQRHMMQEKLPPPPPHTHVKHT